MLAPAKPVHERLLEDLAEFARSNPLSPCVRVQAKHAYTLYALNIDTALLALPLEGHKRFRHQDKWVDVQPGEVFLVPAAQSLDIENIPDEATGRYLAVGMPLHANILEAARHLIPNRLNAGTSAAASISIEPYVDDLNAWLNALLGRDSLRACHAMVGLALRMYEQGFHGLLRPGAPTLSAQIRGMVAIDPSKDWSSEDIQNALAMSGATLRRRLAAEGTSLRDVVVDARLSQGFTLLATTNLPVKTVALRVGYQSASTFSRRFSERYGVEPSRLSNE
jgi:AraC-like DNA-binding protein